MGKQLLKELVLATNNPDKNRELKRLLRGLKIKVSPLDKFPNCPPVKEGMNSLRENAIRKAMAVSQFTKRLALADDSGLEIKALNGSPGVCSSRFAGPKATYADNNRKLLEMLKGKKGRERAARFRCVVAICAYPKLVGVVEGRICGRIASCLKGKYGFGYDPLFIVPKYKKTFAELRPKIKNKISHRAQALKKAKVLIIRYFAHNRFKKKH